MGRSAQQAEQVGIRTKTESTFAEILSRCEGGVALSESEISRLKWMFEQGYTHASIDALQGQNVYLNAELSLKSAPRPADLAL